MRKMGVFIGVLVFLCFTFSLDAAEKKASVVGKKVVLEELFKTTEIGAVTFMNSGKALKNSRLYIIGKKYNSLKPTIDGRNHNLEGALLKKNPYKVHALSTNLKKKRYIRVWSVRLFGKKPNKNTKAEYLDIKEIVDFLKKHADFTITKDTECDENGCRVLATKEKVEYNFGSKAHPKIVVVDGARLVLKGDFKGYGVLILTGDRKKVPFVFADESIKDIVTNESLYKELVEIIKKIRGLFIESIRRNLRLTMEDGAFWGGLIVSDIGINSTKYKKSRQLVMILGRQVKSSKLIVPKIIKIQPFSLRKLLETEAYARAKVDVKIKGKFREFPEKSPPTLPSVKRVKVCGAILLGGKSAVIKMGSADILYSKSAIDLVDNLIKSFPFEWEEYREEE